MRTKRKDIRQQSTEQQRKVEAESARQADALRNNQPHEILNRANMQRQAKKMHEQDGK